MYALLCLRPVKLSLHYGHSIAPNPYNNLASLVPYGRYRMASIGM